jgi:hypothetical protein
MPIRTEVCAAGVVGGAVVGTGAGAVVVGTGAGAVVVGTGAGAVVVGTGAGAVVVGDGAGAVVVGDGAGAVAVGDGAGVEPCFVKVTTSLGPVAALPSLETTEAVPEVVVTARPMLPAPLIDLVMSTETLVVLVDGFTVALARAAPMVMPALFVIVVSDQLVAAVSTVRVEEVLLARASATLADESV